MNRQLVYTALIFFFLLVLGVRSGTAQLLEDRNKLRTERGPRRNFSNDKVKTPSKTKDPRVERAGNVKYSQAGTIDNQNRNVNLKARMPKSKDAVVKKQNVKNKTVRPTFTDKRIVIIPKYSEPGTIDNKNRNVKLSARTPKEKKSVVREHKIKSRSVAPTFTDQRIVINPRFTPVGTIDNRNRNVKFSDRHPSPSTFTDTKYKVDNRSVRPTFTDINFKVVPRTTSISTANTRYKTNIRAVAPTFSNIKYKVETRSIAPTYSNIKYKINPRTVSITTSDTKFKINPRSVAPTYTNIKYKVNPRSITTTTSNTKFKTNIRSISTTTSNTKYKIAPRSISTTYSNTRFNVKPRYSKEATYSNTRFYVNPRFSKPPSYVKNPAGKKDGFPMFDRSLRQWPLHWSGAETEFEGFKTKKHKIPHDAHPSANYLTAKYDDSAWVREAKRKTSVTWVRVFGNKNEPKGVSKKPKKAKFDKDEAEIWNNEGREYTR